MLTNLFWPIVCLVAGLLLLFVEVFIPSGGLIGFLSIGMLVVSLWLGFTHSTTTGLALLVSLLVLLPMTLGLAVKLWPKTPMGKRLILRPPDADELLPESFGPPLEHLIGQFGRTLTPLRPSGAVDFEGRRLDGLSEEGLIPTGSLVQAVQVRGHQLVVRLAPSSQLEQLNSI